MLWSPIVKTSRDGSKYNQMNDIDQIKNIIKERLKVNITAIINEEYLECISVSKKESIRKKI